MEKNFNKKTNISISAPILVLAVLLLFEISKILLKAYFREDSNLYIVSIVTQVIVFILPSALYFQLRGRKFSEPLNLRFLKPKYFPVTLSFTFLFLVTITIVKFVMYYLTDGSYIATTANDLIELISPKNDYDPLFVIVAFVIVPTICEELFFRGVILSEYQAYGSINAVLVSALFFAMFHFSAINFLSYFTCGLLFGFVTIVTRSVLPAMFLHMLNNILSMYTTDTFLKMMIRESGMFFVGFILLVLFLSLLVITLGRVEHIYYTYAKDPPTESIPALSRGNSSALFSSPSLWLLIGVFILISFIN